MKKILGLDLGTNSIGWALVEKPENDTKQGKILGLGSRIIPIGDDKTNFEQGLALTRNADRRRYRGVRKLNKRYKQRRNKLIYVLKELGILPDFIKWDGEFPEPTKIQKLSIKPIDKGSKQQNALEIFELRSKALNKKVELKDFGRILYILDQLRGYAGGGDNEEDKTNKKENDEKTEDASIKKYEVKIDVVKILSEPKVVGKVKSRRGKDEGKEIPEYEITVVTSDGEEYTGTTLLDILKQNEEFELELRIRRNKKDEISSVKLSLPKKSNWRVEFEKLEKELNETGEHISEYYHRKLTENPWYRVRSHVILRSRYKAEFDEIWKQQSQHYDFLNNTPKDVLEKIAKFLFPGEKESQKKYREEAINKGLKHIIKEQIIYYQRPLKPQMKLIGNCRYEKELKVLPISHPLQIEYTIWQQINNLSINTVTDVSGKKQYYDRSLNAEQKELLYELLQNQKELSYKVITTKLKLRDKIDYLNGLNFKAKLKGNETKITIKKTLGDELFAKLSLDDAEKLTELWRILYNWFKDDNVILETNEYDTNPRKYQFYNPNSDNEYDAQSERVQSINNFLKLELGNEYERIINRELLLKIAKLRFKRSYRSLSAKAINNILPLMKAGKYYSNDSNNNNITNKIIKLKNDEYVETIEDSLIDYHKKYPDCFIGGGLKSSDAAMLVYGKHTTEEFEGVNDYHNIKTFEQRKKEDPQNTDKYTLRNPIVEQITNETLQVIKSIWKQYKIKPDEIKIELSRELKNNAEERNKIYKAVLRNEKENKRIKERLAEHNIELSLSNIERYKLWEQQNYLSPYTSETIPLNELFDIREYDVDHIIPRSRFFDDSLANKIVCETKINIEKGNRTAWEYINSGSTEDKILNVENYIEHVNKIFFGRKRKNLLLKEIPKDFVERQKKDSQYISIKVKEELEKIVGTENVKTSTGGITDYLRQHWGLNEKFKEITKHRYELMSKMCDENWVEEIHNPQTNKTSLKIKNWSKRFDHRHHALDALVVALTEQSHIQRLNNLNKELQKWLNDNKQEIKQNFTGSDEELMNEFLNLSKEKREKIIEKMPSFRKFDVPWPNLPDETKQNLESIIVSHKPKQKLLIQKDKNGQIMLKIRGPLHQETYYGKNDTYRLPVSKLSNKTDIVKFIDLKIVSKSIAETLKKHLRKYNNDAKDAFSEEGITQLNKERKHKLRAVKVRYAKDDDKETKLQPLDKKYYPKNSILVKTGSNYCFAITEKEGNRKFGIIPFFDSVNLLKESIQEGKKNKELVIREYFENTCETTKGSRLLFTLSQDDLVYFPKEDEENIPLKESENNYKEFWNNIDRNRIFNVVKFTGNTCYFTQHNISQELSYRQIENLGSDDIKTKPKTYNEFGSNDGCCPYIYKLDDGSFHQNNQLNKMLSKNPKGTTFAIQDTCIKISVDRLGNIKPAVYD
ncbi:MAG: type II CRISPR RNA-guided endonuclease Cas9 [Chlorobi bacterium]|nr:type II CRISPR RNA-guided endonuclease Cas9 [Chlorobiota bacterium]MCI0716942.1 type II CRISPR RNA-guided endonuclease Cas9 [Chlorobiota bacterium]